MGRKKKLLMARNQTIPRRKVARTPLALQAPDTVVKGSRQSCNGPPRLAQMGFVTVGVLLCVPAFRASRYANTIRTHPPIPDLTPWR